MLMLLLFEIKKILKRFTIWGLLGFAVITALTSVCVTIIFFNEPPAEINPTANWTELKYRIQNWQINETDRSGLKTALDDFHNAYKIMNATAATGAYYDAELAIARLTFQTFSAQFTGLQPEYWLIRPGELAKLQTGMAALNNFFTDWKITLADTNTEWEKLSLSSIMNGMYVQNLTSAQLTKLNDIIRDLDAGDDNSMAYINCAYKILYNNYTLELSKNTPKLYNYDGFTDFKEDTALSVLTLNGYLLENNLHDNSSNAFAFGDIYNSGADVSLFDFIFTNLELAAIPLIAVVIILTAAAFFTDIQTNVIFETLTTRRKRAGIVLTKISAAAITAFALLLSLIFIYAVCGILIFNATVSPDIVTLFNNKSPVKFTQINFFVLYVLSLVFKLSVFMLGSALFSLSLTLHDEAVYSASKHLLSKSKPIIVVGFTMLVAACILLANALLGGVIFYQYIPLLALEPIKYLGATLFLSPMPTSFNLLYTLPLLCVLLAVGFWQLIYNFSNRDF